METWQGGGKFVGGARKKAKESSGMPSGKFCMAIAFSSLWCREYARGLSVMAILEKSKSWGG